jgi:hypothetical protein
VESPGDVLFADDCVDLELDQPFRVDEARHFYEGAGWPHRSEALGVRAGRLAPLAYIDEHDPGADHVCQRPAGLRQCLLGYIEATQRLPVDVTWR